MQNVHIAQIYLCSKVTLASELFYICELGKYLKYNHDACLSIDGVILDDVLQKSSVWDYFRLAVDEGWVVDSGLTESQYNISADKNYPWTSEELYNILYVCDEVPFDKEDNEKRRFDAEYNLRNPMKKQVSFEVRTNDYWLWTYKGEDGKFSVVNNKAMNNTHSKTCWVSLVAYVAIERLMTNSPEKLLIQFNATIVQNSKALSYFLSLDDKTSCFFGWCAFNFDNSVTLSDKLHLGYLSWYVEGEDMGYLNRWYSPKEKFEHLKKLDLRVGDVVMLYERNRAQRLNYVKSIASCHLAIIKELDRRKITLLVCNTTKTYAQGKADFDDKTMIVKQMYMNGKPYENFNSTVRSFDISDMGIEYEMYSESYFIVPLTDTVDSRETLIGVKGEAPIKVELPQNEFCYWLLREYDIEFNIERYKQRYIDADEPVYDQYLRDRSVPEQYLL